MRFIACAPSSGKTLNQREIDNVCLSFRACQSNFPLPWYTLYDMDRKHSLRFDLRRLLAFPLLEDLVKELSVDGVLDVPDHFHTALFYSRDFHFLEPEIEGRLREDAYTNFRVAVNWDLYREKIATRGAAGKYP